MTCHWIEGQDLERNHCVKAFREFGPREEVEEGGQDGNEDAGFEDVGAIVDGEGEGLQLRLPPHQRRASHTLNLMASKDLERAVSPGATRCDGAMAKCAALWKKAHRSPEVCERLAVPKLLANELAFLNEYAGVLKTLALTFFKGKQSAFLDF
ncbi:hypothetical protein KUCAC02_016882 [Chaenocephalus aceratus]|nr:hypothetical protein KUCAC02_016882 [Chaenocephalus aceratus]